MIAESVIVASGQDGPFAINRSLSVEGRAIEPNCRLLSREYLPVESRCHGRPAFHSNLMTITIRNYSRRTDRHQFGTLIGIARNPQQPQVEIRAESRERERAIHIVKNAFA